VQADGGQISTDCAKAVELNPRFAKAYSNRGNPYYHKGLYDEATFDYDRA